MNNTFKLALAGALCVPTLAQACSCAPPPAPKIALESSAAVFVGRVTSVEKGDLSSKYQFSVSKQWKGVKGNATSIVTANDSVACGINFDSDRDYLVYAFKNDDGQLRANMCSRTKRVSDAATDLAELGAPVKITATDAPAKPTDALKYYRIAANGDVQVSAKPTEDPLVLLSKAIQDNEFDQRFRVNWKAPTNPSFLGTALYNRKDSTLKAYSRADTNSGYYVNSVLYSGVTDDVLKKLASTDKIEDFFRTYANYGVTKKDVGSKVFRTSD